MNRIVDEQHPRSGDAANNVKIMKVTRDGLFAKSGLFSCPYGIAFDRAGNLHVVNYNDNRMTKVDPQGAVTLFATVSEKDWVIRASRRIASSRRACDRRRRRRGCEAVVSDGPAPLKIKRPVRGDHRAC